MPLGFGKVIVEGQTYGAKCSMALRHGLIQLERAARRGGGLRQQYPWTSKAYDGQDPVIRSPTQHVPDSPNHRKKHRFPIPRPPHDAQPRCRFESVCLLLAVSPGFPAAHPHFEWRLGRLPIGHPARPSPVESPAVHQFSVVRCRPILLMTLLMSFIPPAVQALSADSTFPYFL